MRGVRAAVLDRRLTPTPPGVAGELYLGGNRLARGYLRHPGLTAERFVADPFGPPGSRLYRTGDLVRWLDDGSLEFLGRTDHQVKIRGYRVELREIETALARLPEISQALADLRGIAGREYLVAYLDTAAGIDVLSDSEIRTALAGWLPAYMIPARFIRLNGFPRQAHGKIDRKAFPEPDSMAPAVNPGRVAPRNQTERTIADIWMQILELPEVGVHDNFFDLGGNSLLATRVVARLRKSLGHAVAPVGVMDIFKYPTVAELAVFMTQTGDFSSPQLLYELTPLVREDERTLSFVCAPYGGAHASVYAELAAALPAGNSLYAIQVPGRDLGLPEEQLPIDRLAQKCTEEILRSIRGPLVIYGHCAPGGALAVAIAQQMEARGRQVEAVYLGGIFPTAQPTGWLLKPLTRLIEMDRLRSDRHHANWLRGMGSDISDLDTDQTRVMVRAMREDGRLAEAYFTELFSGGARKLRAPVISVVGERDPSSAFYQERYLEWALLSDSLAVVLLREAGHFFVRHRAAELAEIVTLTHQAILNDDTAGLSRIRLGDNATWWLHDCTTITARTAPDDLRLVPDRTSAIAEGGPRTNPRRVTAAGPAPGMRRFLAVALAQLVSITGSTLTEFALPLWVYLSTGSLARFGLLAVASLVPGIVAAPLAGAIVDRYDRRRVMIAGDLAAGTAEAFLLVLAWASALQLWQVYVVAAFLSAALAFQRTAYMSAIPQIVPKRYLGHANGIVQAATGFAQFIAPLIGVGLLAAVGLRGILSVDAVSYAIAIGTVLLVRFPVTMAVRRTESMLAEIAEGLWFTLRQPSFRAMIILFAALSLALAPLFILVSPLVLSFSSLSAVAEMAVIAGAGAAAAGLVMTVWGGPQIRRMLGIRLMAFVLAVSALLLGLRPNLISIGVGVFGVGFCVSTINGIIMTIIQTKVPQRLQGRVIALNTMIAATAVPFGFGVVAPYGPRLLQPLSAATGTTGMIVRVIVGTGPGREIGLLDIACAAAIALLALWAGRFRRLARFDVDVHDALPDDLVGIESMGQVTATAIGGHREPSPGEP
jgi:surfactin synthase thioesterase subunit/MFS family permease